MRFFGLVTCLTISVCIAVEVHAAEPEVIRDRTLVVWAAVSDLGQKNTGMFVVQNGAAVFDGLIYAELKPKAWMAGSDFFRRTQHDQSKYPQETEAGKLVQLAIVSKGKEVELYRDGVLVSRYPIPGEPISISTKSEVLFGVHHLEMLGSMKFRGEVEDARIYDRALSWQFSGAIDER